MIMFSETEIVAQFSRLEAHVLEHWIAAGWLKPKQSEEGFLFDDADVARAHFLCDLAFEMELGDEELAMVVSLVDRLNGARAMLQALTQAVQSQPAAVREAIMAEMGVLLGGDIKSL
jgi:chaperone modulatory protein CbpM